VYEATVHAVPFLVEIAAARDLVPAAIRAHVLLLTMDISRGTSYLDVHGPLLRDSLSDDERVQLKRELEWVAAARDAVREQVPMLLGLLDEESPAIQAAAAGIAAQFPEDASSRLSRVDQLRATSSGPAHGLYELLSSLLLGRPVSHVLMRQVASASEDVADYLEGLRETGMTLEEQSLAVAAELAERSVAQALGF
jgi:hypothetical protein